MANEDDQKQGPLASDNQTPATDNKQASSAADNQSSPPPAPQDKKPPGKPGIDDIFKDAGKSDEEAKKTGEVDNLDRTTDKLFDPKKATNQSPVFKALWGGMNLEHFRSKAAPENKAAAQTVAEVLEAVRKHRDAPTPTIYGPDNKLSSALIADLAAAGYFGIRIPVEYGGKAADLRTVMKMVIDVGSKGDLTVAGMTNVHGLIGVVDPLLVTGMSPVKEGVDQAVIAKKKRLMDKFLPDLASGKALSFFALTEPGAGSDLTNIKTRASWKDGKLVVNGHKVFISNSNYGRTGALVCMYKEKDEHGVEHDNKALFVIKLPETDTPNFELAKYGLHPLVHMDNHGLIFKDFEIDPENRVQRFTYDGKPVANSIGLAYEALNKGRTAVCAMGAAGSRVILNTLAPNGWADYRETYGQKIKDREGVQGAMARIAMLICGLDAMVDWCSTLLDEGWRGELECIVAKNFGANAITEVAIFHGMRLHGGRSMLKGHFIGDNMPEFLVNRIYEGAWDMLTMALILSSCREHLDGYMAPLGQNMKQLTKSGQPVAGLVGLGVNGSRLAGWWMGQKGRQVADRLHFHPKLSQGDGQFQKYINYADSQFAKLALTLNAKMVKHQLKLIDRQLLLQRMGVRLEKLVILTRCAVAGSEATDKPTRLGLDLMCRSLVQELTGKEPDEKYDADCRKLAQHVMNGEFRQLDGVQNHAIMFPYKT